MITVGMIAGNFELNGISSVIYNYCKHLDKSKFRVVLFVGTPVNENLCQCCRDVGVTVHLLPRRRTHTLQYCISLYRALTKERIDIVHINGSSATIAIELLVTKFAGIRYRVAHSHSTSCSNYKAHRLLRPIANWLCTDALACSNAAGNWLFNKRKYTVIYNGIDTNTFRFDENKRRDVRQRLGIEKSILIGHVGRMNGPKNQMFVIDVFEYLSRKTDAFLLLVGTGPDVEKVKKRVNESVCQNRIIMYGETDNVQELYSAMDVFLFPSKHEGLPLTMIEAQANGVPCVVSDMITDEVIIADNVTKLSLDESVEVWSRHVTDSLASRQNNELDLLRLIDKHFNIYSNVKRLEDFYYKVMGKCE